MKYLSKIKCHTLTSNNTDVSVVSVHETHRETHHARFYIIYNRTCNHGWKTVP